MIVALVKLDRAGKFSQILSFSQMHEFSKRFVDKLLFRFRLADGEGFTYQIIVQNNIGSHGCPPYTLHTHYNRSVSPGQLDFFYLNSDNKDMKSTLSGRGQMTIPKRIREQLGLRPGQELEFETRDGLLIGRKRMSGDPVSSVTAILNPLDVDGALEESRRP